MFSFFKKNAENSKVPEWASFFTSDEYSTFIKEIDNYFKSINVDYEIGNEQINIKDEEFGFGHLGLTNVSQNCKQSETKYYKEIITEHFDSLIRSKKFEEEFEKIADHFEEVKKYIGVRLYDNSYVACVGKENTLGKDLAGDIYAMIVFDFPDSVVSIKPENIIAWNKTPDELFEIGVANIKGNYPVTITKEKFGEFSFWFVQGQHFFTPNIVFDIENKPELIGSKGSLVGLPHRRSAIIYPIENLEVVKAINSLIPVIYGMNQEGPGSLSNQLFWYKDKVFTPLPYKLENNKMQFFPPDNFLEILNELK